MNFLEKLNPEQREAVLHRDGPLLILAGAGSGKMRERVESLIGETAAGVWLSTFPSLCARLLRREAPKIGLSRDFVIYDSSDQVAVVKQALRELNIALELVPPRMA